MGRIYSHSSLSCFENCPRQFYHRYIARSKPMAGADTIEAFRGLQSPEDRAAQRGLDPAELVPWLAKARKEEADAAY